MLAAGRNNFSSSSEAFLTQQTPHAPTPPQPVLLYQRKPPTSFPRAPATPVCVWATKNSDCNSALCGVLPLPLACVTHRGLCANLMLWNLSHSCQAEPGAQQFMPQGSLFKHSLAQPEQALSNSCFSHSLLSTAVLASSSNTMEKKGWCFTPLWLKTFLHLSNFLALP